MCDYSVQATECVHVACFSNTQYRLALIFNAVGKIMSHHAGEELSIKGSTCVLKLRICRDYARSYQVGWMHSIHKSSLARLVRSTSTST